MKCAFWDFRLKNHYEMYNLEFISEYEDALWKFTFQIMLIHYGLCIM